jgi:hypothetical protein
MVTRYVFPVILSVAGLLFFLLPLTSANNTNPEENTVEMYTGSNTFSCDSDNLMFDPNTSITAMVSHHDELFYLNLWIGGYENRITFVLRDEDIKEGAFELDDPSKRYLSFLYHDKDCTYASDDYYTGILMIHKYDTTHKIIAGSFEFMAHSDECNELVRINHGRFDATYMPYESI